MIDAQYFDQPAEAELVLDRAGKLVEALAQLPARVTLVRELDGRTEKRILELKDEVFGRDSDVFEQRTLTEVAEDPDAMFLLLEIDGNIEGCCFGYHELPGEETVPDTQFFLDTGLISTKWQERGIAGAAGAGVLLLVDLLHDVHRVGIAVWDGGGRVDDLVALYQRFGFVLAESGNSPYRCMTIDLDEDRVNSWRTAMGLPGRTSGH